MKLTFIINYHTNWGENIRVYGNIPQLGENNPDAGLELNFTGDQTWTGSIEIPDGCSFEYGYAVVAENGFVKTEWGAKRQFSVSEEVKDIVLYDRWQDQPADKPFYSSAITDCLNRRSSKSKKVELRNGFLTLKVEAPMIRPDETIAICGGCDVLGNWNPAKALKMSDAEFPVWAVNIDGNTIAGYPEFKFVILNKKTGEFIRWQGGDNLRLPIEKVTPDFAAEYSGLRFNYSGPLWRGAGVAIPVFSLRSDEDFGAGDFMDLKLMVDWAHKTGQNFIQILPINDTTMTHTWTDSYPYNANSTFALHPMYLRLEMLGTIKDKKRQDYYEKLRVELNALNEIDYERVINAKIEYTKEIFAQDGAKVLKSAPFKRFLEKNADWLTPYAAFCVLRDLNGTPDFTKWGAYSVYDKDAVANFIETNSDKINFVYYQQFNLDKQLKEVVDYAHKKGVAIKGDIPIGISRTSVDAWLYPRLFNMNSQAGAPPDDFSVLGQNWGFPTYNWEEMSLDGFDWWKKRFRKMSEYFDAYRIDHVLGFFRIWQIPMEQIHGLLGVFHPALPFTPDELRNSYDFWINTSTQAEPYIADWFLGDFFGEYTEEVKSRFLQDKDYGTYSLKPEYSTQRKIADFFETQEKNDKNNRICNGLLGLVDNVLFIEDPIEKGKYHPRISAQFTYAYRALNDYEKWCYDRLYNDFFYRRHNDFWYGKAMWKLIPLTDATNMLTCAEDLGMIPACVPAVMERLQMLSLEIQRMPKDPNAKFGDTWHYPYYSVCTTSTHDMGGIRSWWEENHDASQQFYNSVLHEYGEAPFYAEPWICDKIVDQHLKSPSMLCILPLQDWMSIDGNIRRQNPQEEQINVPANSRHYWRYRMHLTLENLNTADSFNNRVIDLIKNSGR